MEKERENPKFAFLYDDKVGHLWHFSFFFFFLFKELY